MRILLADDHTLVRAGIRALVESLPDVEAIEEAGDGREALSRMAESKPDIALVDITMPGMNGLELLARAGKESPKTRIVILSMHSSPSYVSTALRAGAAGYLLKDAAAEELPLVLRAVLRGETYLSPAISRVVVEGYLRRPPSEPGKAPSLDGLTPRQREILQLVAEGKSTKEVAQILDLGVKTVETHRSQIMERLQIHDIAGLVRYAVRIGLVSVDK
jgi:DNA-binding NarL/FixJ family response regulator